MAAVTLARLSDVASIAPSTCEGRLTLETGVPISSTDQTAKTTLYFTPYLGARISTYSGSVWTTSTFTEKSISLAGLTANSNYDCFIVDSTLALELVIWTNDTTRATALTTQDGVLVKSGATTRRYLGTIRTTNTTGQCEDSMLRRLVWNQYNQIQRPLLAGDATASWTYATATWRQARGSAANQIDWVCGQAGRAIVAHNATRIAPTTTQFGQIGIGLNRTNNVDSAQGVFIAPNFTSGTAVQVTAEYVGVQSLGYTYLAAVEIAGGATVTFFGSGYLYLTTSVMA